MLVPSALIANTLYHLLAPASKTSVNEAVDEVFSSVNVASALSLERIE